MEEEIKRERNSEFSKKAYSLLSWANKGENITVRDDQYDFVWVLDSAKLCRKRGFRFRLIDTGKFCCSELEWLAEAGADLYTSDEARSDTLELELLNKACRKGRAFMAYFHYGPIERRESEGESNSVSFSELMNLGANGIYLHLTNRKNKRDFSHLNQLAFACRKGGSWLVYYHHGPLEAPLKEFARNGAWIHITDKSIKESEDVSLLFDIIKSARLAGTRLVLYLEKGLDFALLREILGAGAFVLFSFSLFDYKSPFRNLEKEAKRKKLNFRAFYLYTHFLP